MGVSRGLGGHPGYMYMYMHMYMCMYMDMCSWFWFGAVTMGGYSYP